MDKIQVGISSCLLGHQVRYDGAHKYNDYIEQTLGKYFEFRAFCPEVESGMPIPRPAIQLFETANVIRVIGVKNPEFDATEQLENISRQQYDWLCNLSGYILKKDSPSCGMQRVKIYNGQIPIRNGTGIFAAYLQQTFPDLPVEEEGRLGDPALRENFVQRVYVRNRWQGLCTNSVTVQDLMIFHSRHKLIAMSHDQNLAHDLGRIVANATPNNINEVAQEYFSLLMACLKKVATRKNHVNVLQHIQGYLKTKLDNADKQELIESIENYRLNRLPLIVPLTLLRHHFRKQPDAFIDRSYYMAPHPDELALLNTI